MVLMRDEGAKGRRGRYAGVLLSVLVLCFALVPGGVQAGSGVVVGDRVRIVTQDTDVVEGELLDKTPQGYLVRGDDGVVHHVAYGEILALKELETVASPGGAGSESGERAERWPEEDDRSHPAPGDGTLFLSAQPPLQVEIDGVPRGVTDDSGRDIPVSPGTHDVIFHCVAAACEGFQRRSAKKTLAVGTGERVGYHVDFYALNGLVASQSSGHVLSLPPRVGDGTITEPMSERETRTRNTLAGVAEGVSRGAAVAAGITWGVAVAQFSLGAGFGISNTRDLTTGLSLLTGGMVATGVSMGLLGVSSGVVEIGFRQLKMGSPPLAGLGVVGGLLMATALGVGLVPIATWIAEGGAGPAVYLGVPALIIGITGQIMWQAQVGATADAVKSRLEAHRAGLQPLSLRFGAAPLDGGMILGVAARW